MPATSSRADRRRPRRVLLGAVGAAATFAAFVMVAGLVPTAQSPPPPSVAVRPSIVVRTPQHLARAGDVDPVVARFAGRNVRRAWVQVKQDETDEFAAGSAFYPSRIAPVAKGYRDGRLGTFITRLAGEGIEPLAWMPVLLDAQAAKQHPEWRSQRIAPDGTITVEREWLCPFAPGVADYQASIAAEVATRFPELGGLYLDFIRYDDDYSCASPRALAQLESRTNWRERMGRRLIPMDIRRAGRSQNWLWTQWTDLRAEKIVDTVNTIRDAVDAVRPDFHIGAFVLPFSSTDYELNTQAGQDLERMAQAGLDEIVLMGYWDDWDKSPSWVRESLDGAARLIDGETDLSVVLDGDMGVRRTRLTLEAIGPWASTASWFNFDPWSQTEFRRLAAAVDGHLTEGPMPDPDYVSVVIRVDTEPDYQPSYEAVRPLMIDALVEMFGEEDVRATFITVGKLAALQPEAIGRAAAAGHEIGSHSYDHEQIDALAVEQQIAAVDGGLSTLRSLGFDVHGFGAPRNSITDEARDRLIDWNLEYDGSAAYDPLTSLIDVHYARDSRGTDNRIVVVPFVIPNDYDARNVAEMSAAEMTAAWTRRLDKVVEGSEPVFVLDVHQWSASTPENLAALRAFIRYAKGCEQCRVETLREGAAHARRILDRYELPATTSGHATRGRMPTEAPAALPSTP